MKRFIPMVLLTFVLSACQDEGPAIPVEGPQFAKSKDCEDPKWQNHPSCAGGGGEGTLQVEFGGSMITPQPVVGVKAFADNDKKLQLNNGSDNLATIEMHFGSSYEVWQAGDCWVVPADSAGTDVEIALAEQLLAVADNAFFVMQVDRRNLGFPSGKHGLEVTYTAATLGEVVVGYHPYRNPTATLVGDNVYEFTGLVRVKLQEGRVKDWVRLFCDNNGDAVRVTLTEEP